MVEKINNKQLKVVYDYDLQNDSLLFYITKNYTYKESIEIDNNIILDFDENYIPVAIEILDATKIFQVPKFSIKNILKWVMIIDITKDLININISTIMSIKQKKVEKTVLTKALNNIKMPPLQNAHFNFIKPVKS